MNPWLITLAGIAKAGAWLVPCFVVAVCYVRGRRHV